MAGDSLPFPRVGAAKLLHQDSGGWLESTYQATICGSDPQGCERNGRPTAWQKGWDEKSARDLQNAWLVLFCYKKENSFFVKIYS